MQVLNFRVSRLMNRLFRHLRLENTTLMLVRDILTQSAIQLSPKAESKLSDAIITSTVETSAPLAVKQAFMTLFLLWEDLFELLMLIAFSIYLTISDTKSSHIQKAFICLIPVVNLVADALLLRLKLPPQANNLRHVAEARYHLLDFLMECIALRRTITTFSKGASMSDQYREKHEDYNRHAHETNEYRWWLIEVAELLPTLLSAVLMFTAGLLVAKEEPENQDIGAFIALLATTTTFGEALGRVFGNICAMYEGFAFYISQAESVNGFKTGTRDSTLCVKFPTFSMQRHDECRR